LGDAPRIVEYWVRRFEDKGLARLGEGEGSDRPRRLSDEQFEKINAGLRRTSKSVEITSGLSNGKTLGAFVKKRYGVTLRVRQCQYMFKSFAFRLHKPRSLIARMWVPPEEAGLILLHHPTRKSVGHFGAISLRAGKLLFQRGGKIQRVDLP
jgi:transposase